jgi:penicillin amidase
MGPVLIPLLESLDLAPTHEETKGEAQELEKYISLLSNWDYQNDMDSAPAALFNAFWRHLILDTFGDDLPLDWLPDDSRGFEVISQLVESHSSPWWDDRGTSTLEDRDMILRKALEDAVQELQSNYGEDPSAWTWGELHTATFRNQSLGQSGIAPIEALFNRGPFSVGGGSSIVNATAWDVQEGYQVQSLPSERMIVDLSDFDNSLWIHPTGQSGHAFHRNYLDMVDLWRQVEYLPMLWTPEAVYSSYPPPDGLALRPPGEGK